MASPSLAELQQDPRFQKIVATIEGLIDGTKKLVIESRATLELVNVSEEFGLSEIVHYHHTIKVEDTND